MKEVKRIIREYKDGSKEEITGQDLKNFENNLNRASVMGVIHGLVFKSVKWKVMKNEKRRV